MHCLIQYIKAKTVAHLLDEQGFDRQVGRQGGLMSRPRIDLHRRKLSGLLGTADDEAFLIMCWASDALQSGGAKVAERFLKFPTEAATRDMSSPYFIHKWNIETLVNELLSTPKTRQKPGRRFRTLDCRNFNAMAIVAHKLRNLENAYDGETLKRVDVIREIHRLTQRQFEWQYGFLNRPQFYRSAYIYGGSRTTAAFETKYGFTVEDFVLGGFCLRGLLSTHPGVAHDIDLSRVGLTKAKMACIVQKISVSHGEARRLATELRKERGHVSYLKSVLRQYPLITFDRGSRLLGPLPDLVTVRTTSGIFYDGQRFETYCRHFLEIAVPECMVEPEWKYRPVGKKEVATPDILVSVGNVISVVIECKATRMSYEARFSEDPVAAAKRAYNELAKGVFQIWRFASHVRRGLVKGRVIAPDLNGIVLTLDTWLSMAQPMQREVIAEARRMSEDREPKMEEIDRVHVKFVPCTDLEQAYRRSGPSSLLKAMKAATTERYDGFLLHSVHEEFAPTPSIDNGYPFSEKLGEVLSWWNNRGSSEG
jgi:hypothetical protein